MFVFRVPYGPSFQLIRRTLRSMIAGSCGENMLSFVESANCLPKQLCHFALPFRLPTPRVSVAVVRSLTDTCYG